MAQMTREEAESAYHSAVAKGDSARAKQISDALGYEPVPQSQSAPPMVAQPIEGNVDYAQRLGASLTGGMTLGFGDEAGALVGTVASYLDPRPEAASAFDGMGPIERYSSLWQQANERDMGFQEEYPVTAIGSNVGGGIATAVAAAPTKMAQEAFRHAPFVSGALTGGVTAAGHSRAETPGRRAFEIGTGMFGGGATSKLSSGPRLTGQERMAERAKDTVLSRMDMDDITPEAASAQLRKMPEGGAIADVGGENMRRLSETVAQMPGKGANIARQFFDLRQRAAPVRVDNLLQKVLKTKGSYHGAMREVTDRLKTSSKPFYDQARETPVQLTAPLRALNRRLLDTDPNILRDAEKTIRRGGPVTGGEFAFWDQVKKGLDDAAGAAYRQGKSNLGNRYRDMARALVEEIDNQFAQLSDDGVSVYQKARQMWQGDKKMMDALERGRKFLSDDAEDIASIVDDLSPGELEMFRLGAARQLRDKVLGRSETSDVYKAWFNKPLMREKIEALFGDDWRSVAKLHRGMRSEQRMFETQTQSMGNSATARRLMDQASLKGALESPGTATLYGDLKGAAVGGAKALANWFSEEGKLVRNPQLREEIARIIFNGTPGEREALMRQVQMARQMGLPYEEVFNPSIPIAGAAGAGALVTQ